LRLDREWIERHLPHQGSMCLLDEVQAWDASWIECRSATHRALDNPLRAYGRLGSACGIEYAAQAMALHGALVSAPSSAAPVPGYLAGVRNVMLYVARIDDVEADIVARAELVASYQGAVSYSFTVRAGDRVLLTGRATIVLDPAALKPSPVRAST
jgi:predicted hotdog family 3-hydroxylacyl-ACP dehydratase